MSTQFQNKISGQDKYKVSKNVKDEFDASPDGRIDGVEF